ncbi:DNA glycosylase AlkZ-like family protein [uncultured Propionivibrio sp.]|uniref:DNA glycosylase AlkZ-like family protein n=1 Tax=uncultured Propionivibrio sp. TaxID=426737 RepID=UPI0029C08A27|nr:hypothetical protein [uncultured Propionivibrio sp.]
MKTPDPHTSQAMQRILRVLEKKPNMSVSDISAEAFVGMTTLACGGYIKALRVRGCLFISGWRQVNGRFSTPLYSLGDQEDVKRPRVDDSNRDAPGMVRIAETLRRFGPLTYREIAQYSGLSINTVKNSGYLAALVAQGKIHVGDWRRSHGGPMMPVYHPGVGEAAEKPPAVPACDKLRQYRERARIAARGHGLKALVADLR